VFPVRYGQTYSVEMSFQQKTGRWIMSRIGIVILIYRRHKPIVYCVEENVYDYLFVLYCELALNTDFDVSFDITYETGK
jgi:hypothetical protein